MNGTALSSIVDIQPSIPGPDWQIVGTGDFNGNGSTDILWRNPVTGVDSVWLMNGTALSSIVDIQPSITDPNWQIVGPK